MALFPPILNSTQEVFNLDDNIEIKYSTSSFTSPTEVKSVRIKISNYEENNSVLAEDDFITNKIFNGDYFKNIESNEKSIPINKDIFPINKRIIGNLYKIQMQFCANQIWNNESDFSNWYRSQIDNHTFSEWSNVMIIKCISFNEIKIINSLNGNNKENSLLPTFQGIAKFTPDSKEIVDRYIFNLYDTSGKLLETSNWLTHIPEKTYDKYQFKTILKNRTSYKVTYDIISKNGFKTKEKNFSQNNYTFTVDIDGIELTDFSSFKAIDNTLECRNEGYIALELTSKNNLNGIYYLIRSSEKDNFSTWEDVKKLSFLNKKLNNNKYNDFTIEYGIKYKYAIQKENNGIRSSPYFSDNNQKIYQVNFDYAYLYAKDKQLKLNFNNRINSFKHNVLVSKIDTLGSKYPLILRNAKTYYAEFSLSGTISLESDENNNFLQLNNQIALQQPIYSRPKKPNSNNEYEHYIIDLNEKSLKNENLILNERIFREQVESFLNDGECKLYKSPTEGNLIVILTNVTLAPNQTLGRKLYDFSATAYEIAENTSENLFNYNIIQESKE